MIPMSFSTIVLSAMWLSITNEAQAHHAKAVLNLELKEKQKPRWCSKTPDLGYRVEGPMIRTALHEWSGFHASMPTTTYSCRIFEPRHSIMHRRYVTGSSMHKYPLRGAKTPAMFLFIKDLPSHFFESISAILEGEELPDRLNSESVSEWGYSHFQLLPGVRRPWLQGLPSRQYTRVLMLSRRQGWYITG